MCGQDCQGKGRREGEGIFGYVEPSRRNKRHFTEEFLAGSRHKGRHNGVTGPSQGMVGRPEPFGLASRPQWRRGSARKKFPSPLPSPRGEGAGRHSRSKPELARWTFDVRGVPGTER